MTSVSTWLFVDDDERFLSSFLEIFGQWSVDNLARVPRFLTAGNVADALIVLQKERVDVMVQDIRMPKVDGIQLLKLVQRKYPQVKKIVLTGFGDPQVRAMAMQAGAAEFLNKPMTAEDFSPLFEQMLRISLLPLGGEAVRSGGDGVKKETTSREIFRNERQGAIPQTSPGETPTALPNPIEISPVDSGYVYAEPVRVPGERSESQGMSGVLPDVSLSDLVQMLAMSNRRVRLLVKAPAGEGEMVICDGRVHAARCGNLIGAEAACHLLTLQGGVFSVEPYLGGTSPNVDRSCEAILMEAAQKMDEARLVPPQELLEQEEGIERDFRQITGQISHKHRRKVVIIEEESESTENWGAQIDSSLDRQRDGDAGSPSRVWREVIVSDRKGRVVFEHGVGEAARRLDLIEFLSFKSATILEKTGGRRVVRIELAGSDWKALAGLGEEHSFFAVAAESTLDVGELLRRLPPELSQSCALPQELPRH